MSLRKRVQFWFWAILGQKGCVGVCEAWRGGGDWGSKGVRMDLYVSPKWGMSFIFLLLSWLWVNITIKVTFLCCLLINIQVLHLFQYPLNTKGRAYEKSVGTFHLCEKIKNSSWKINWFVPFHLGSLRKYRLRRWKISTLLSLLIWIPSQDL